MVRSDLVRMTNGRLLKLLVLLLNDKESLAHIPLKVPEQIFHTLLLYPFPLLLVPRKSL